MKPFKVPKVVAEIGCNHRGEVETAKQLIVVAKTCNILKNREDNNEQIHKNR